MAPETTSFLGELADLTGEHPALHHPFLCRMRDEPVSVPQLLAYARQHYLYARDFTRNLAALIANVPDEEARGVLIENLYEEIGEPARASDHAHTHQALFRRFLRALGQPEAGMVALSPLPATTRLADTYRRLCREGHWLRALGAMGPGTECVVPRIYGAILHAIERSGAVAAADYAFWTLHVHCDETHGENILDIVARHACDAEGRALVVRGTLAILDARRDWFDALDDHVFGDRAARRGVA